jgi:hypothetical protein
VVKRSCNQIIGPDQPLCVDARYGGRISMTLDSGAGARGLSSGIGSISTATSDVGQRATKSACLAAGSRTVKRQNDGDETWRREIGSAGVAAGRSSSPESAQSARL